MADLHYTWTTTRKSNVHRAIIVTTVLVRPLNPRHRDIKQKIGGEVSKKTGSMLLDRRATAPRPFEDALCRYIRVVVLAV